MTVYREERGGRQTDTAVMGLARTVGAAVSPYRATRISRKEGL
jgi:hypothetical protein